MLADPNQIEVLPKEDDSKTSADETTYQMVLRLLKQGKQHRQLWDKDWNYNYNFVFGNTQWGPNRSKARFSESVNMTWGGIMQETGIETDTEPQTDYVAEEPTDVAFSDILKEINARNWEKYNWNQKFAEAKMEAKVIHVIHTEVKWNTNLEGGLGDNEHVNLNPFYFYWDPQATDIEDARWAIYAIPTPTSQLQAMYPTNPETGEDSEITSDIESLANDGEYYGGISSPSQDLGLLSQSSTGLEKQASGGEPLTKWLRIWIRDDAVEEMEEKTKDESGNEVSQFVLKKKYPNGRYIEIINKKIYRDGGPGVEINGSWVEYKMGCYLPLSRLVNYAYPRRYAGGEEVTQLKGPQKLFNYVWSYCIDNFKATSNPKIIVAHSAGDIADELTNEANTQVIEVPDPNSVRFEYPPGMTPGISNLVDLAKSMLDTVRGTGEITGGKIPANVSSGVFLETSIEIEQTRSRLKARNAKSYLKKIGTLDLILYLQFYTQPRVFRITNKEGFPEHVQFYIQDTDQGRVANVARPGPTGAMVAQQVPVKGMPDVRIEVGSAMPFAKAIKNDAAKSLYQLGAIDREALFDMIDLPNKDAVLKRMQEADAQQQQAAAQAQAAKGG